MTVTIILGYIAMVLTYILFTLIRILHHVYKEEE